MKHFSENQLAEQPILDWLKELVYDLLLAKLMKGEVRV